MHIVSSFFSPLFFPRAGFIYAGYTDNKLKCSRDVGREGDYWSSTISTGSSAYSLYFSDTSVNPSSSDDRFYGFPVRCLVN